MCAKSARGHSPSNSASSKASVPQLQNMSHEFWSNALASHPDKEFVKLILDRVNFGVNIGFNGSSHQVISRNWKSVQSFRPHVLEFINTNLSKNRIEGPLVTLPPNYRCSPLGAFEKPRSDKVRTIHDLSWPPGRSVNDGINTEDYSLKYTSIDSIVSMI